MFLFISFVKIDKKSFFLIFWIFLKLEKYSFKNNLI